MAELSRICCRQAHRRIATMAMLVRLVLVLPSPTVGCRWGLTFSLRNESAAHDPTHWILESENSLCKQAWVEPFLPGIEHERLYDERLVSARNHKTNLDGFGLGWFGEDGTAHVCKSGCGIVDESLNPGPELHSALLDLRSHVVFGHVRSGTQGVNSEDNAHPFVFKLNGSQFLWMHNGGVGCFVHLNAYLRLQVSPSALAQVRGDTDSELAGALFITHLEAQSQHRLKTPREGRYSPENVGAALAATIHDLAALDDLIAILEVDSSTCKAGSSLNFAVSDGFTLAVTRYRSCSTQAPPSLYVHSAAATRGVLQIASEPWDRRSDGWDLLTKDEMLVASAEGAFWRQCLSLACIEDTCGT
mmetsp:Transcript_16978/g.44655  ORF Transcript_16978/g.44655 Transcript_16978/m.44655 type:complete len:360 (+) Transcript_16978:86-1165(+)